MSRIVLILDRVTDFLEQLKVYASNDSPEVPRAVLDRAWKTARDFALVRPILDSLVTAPIPEDDEWMPRRASAPASGAPSESKGDVSPRPLLTAHYQAYVGAGVDPVEAFAIMSNKEASAYFDKVIAYGLEPGPQCELAGKLFVKEIWYSGLKLAVADIQMKPVLLARLAEYAGDKPGVVCSIITLLPDLCQGVSIDDLLERLRASKDEIRKNMLQRYMEALDESEGLQAITARLCERLGVEPRTLSSDTTLDIPFHVRAHLQKYERCSMDRKLLSSMEMQITVLRCVGAKEGRGVSLDGGSQASRAARAAPGRQRAPVIQSPFSNPFSSASQSMGRRSQDKQELRPSGQSSAKLKAEITSSLVLAKYKSSPCTFDQEGRASQDIVPLYSVPHP